MRAASDGGVGDESAPLSCSLCGVPLVEDYVELAERPSGDDLGKFCRACGRRLLSVSSKVKDNALIAIDCDLMKKSEIGTLALVLEAAISKAMTFSASVTIEVVDAGNERILVRVGYNWYRWSRIRTTLDGIGD